MLNKTEKITACIDFDFIRLPRDQYRDTDGNKQYGNDKRDKHEFIFDRFHLDRITFSQKRYGFDTLTYIIIIKVLKVR